MRSVSTDSARGLRIVVTDDNPSLLITLVQMLRTQGTPSLPRMMAEARVSSPSTSPISIWSSRIPEAKPWLAVLHIGDPLPQHGPLRDVRTLSEPFTSVELLAAIAALLDATMRNHALPAR